MGRCAPARLTSSSDSPDALSNDCNGNERGGGAVQKPTSIRRCGRSSSRCPGLRDLVAGALGAAPGDDAAPPDRAPPDAQKVTQYNAFAHLLLSKNGPRTGTWRWTHGRNKTAYRPPFTSVLTLICSRASPDPSSHWTKSTVHLRKPPRNSAPSRICCTRRTCKGTACQRPSVDTQRDLAGGLG